MKSFASKACLDEIPKVQRRAVAKRLKEYVAGCVDPKETMAKAYRSGDYTMNQIAQQFGVHYSTVSRAVKAMEDTWSPMISFLKSGLARLDPVLTGKC